MNIFIVFLVFYGVVATPISTTNNNQKITEGFDAYPGQFPFQASIRTILNSQHYCSGSIISDEWILTSATCSGVLKPDQMKIVVGSMYLNSGGTTHAVLFTLEHPGHNASTNEDDIGLILVQDRISFNEFTQPIELFNGDTAADLPLITSGWGFKSVSSWILPNNLQHATLKALSAERCAEIFITALPYSQLCTYNFNSSKQGLCLYDSGNPLVNNGKLHAIAIATMYCVTLLPDIHTRVAPYRNWIRNITDV